MNPTPVSAEPVYVFNQPMLDALKVQTAQAPVLVVLTKPGMATVEFLRNYARDKRQVFLCLESSALGDYFELSPDGVLRPTQELTSYFHVQGKVHSCLLVVMGIDRAPLHTLGVLNALAQEAYNKQLGDWITPGSQLVYTMNHDPDMSYGSDQPLDSVSRSRVQTVQLT